MIRDAKGKFKSSRVEELERAIENWRNSYERELKRGDAFYDRTQFLEKNMAQFNEVLTGIKIVLITGYVLIFIAFIFSPENLGMAIRNTALATSWTALVTAMLLVGNNYGIKEK